MDIMDMVYDESVMVEIEELLELEEEQYARRPSRAYIYPGQKSDEIDSGGYNRVPERLPFCGGHARALKPDQIKVQLEDNGNILVVSGERRREKDKEKGKKYVKMERRFGKFLRKFTLFENANRDAIFTVYEDGVLTVTVEKLPQAEPKSIQVNVGSSSEGPKPVEAQVK